MRGCATGSSDSRMPLASAGFLAIRAAPMLNLRGAKKREKGGEERLYIGVGEAKLELPSTGARFCTRCKQ